MKRFVIGIDRRWARAGVSLAALWFALCLGAAAGWAQTDALDDLDQLQTPSGQQAQKPPPAAPSGGGGDDLGGLGGLEGLPQGGSALPSGGAPAASAPSDEGGLKLSFNGYVKPVAVWEHREYPDSLGGAKYERFSVAGARTQLRATGVIKDRAQFFTAVNFDFNEVDTSNDTASSSSENGALRMVEGYVDLLGSDTRWRVGSQIVTWGFMDGFEVVTDRLNARDQGYKSNELEDNKLASTGAEFSWSFVNQRLDLFYIPVPKANRLDPDTAAVFNEDDTKGTEAESGDSKYAAMIGGKLPIFDYQLSYVDGRNPRADLATVPDPTNDVDGVLEYHRAQSTGLDLQFDFGSFLGRVSGVFWNTADIGNDDPNRQNDWWQAMVGVEFFVGAALVQINAGQKQVVDFQNDNKFENLLLGQSNGTVDVIAGMYTDSFFQGDAVELSFLYAYLWDNDSGELVALRVRPSFTYNYADGVGISFLPYYSNEVGVETIDLYTEVKYSF